MTRIWKTFGLLALVAAALVAGPSAVRADEQADLKDMAKRIKHIEEALTQIQRSADAVLTEGLKYQVLLGKINKLEEQMGKVQGQLDALKKEPPPKERTSAYPPENIDDIQKRLAQIERLLERMGPAPRVARFPPATDAGRILLTNRYPEDMLFIINGRENIRLAPGTSRLVEGVPAGTFTYEVVSPTWGSRARKTTTLLANETYRITVD